MGRSGYNDRRGFNSILWGSLATIPVGVILMFAYHWLVGLIVALLAAICYIAVEGKSAAPANDARAFGIWQRRQQRRRPVLVCLGDSLTHGTCSASITPEIPTKLCAKLGMELPKYGAFFSDPLWVVNCGQNYITSQTIREERLNTALGCYPDYILLWIGCNDIRALTSDAMKNNVTKVNELRKPPTMESFEANIKGILNYIEESSPTVKIGLCTLAPLGEDLQSPANKLIRQANDIVTRAAEAYGPLCSVVPIFDTLEEALAKKKRGRGFQACFFSESL